jgi:hypothetical protein
MRLATSLLLAGLVALPHSLSAQWTQGAPGKIWVKSALFIQNTDERYTAIGEREPYFAEGVADSKALYTEFIVGLHPKLDFWLQVPYFDLTFTDNVQTLSETGIGDVRAWLRWNPIRLFGGRTPISIRAGAKAPLGESPIDAQIIPLGEGQWDLEAFGEIGHSFWPVPAYAILWLGYRVRFENTEQSKDPGNEFVFLAEAGVNPTPGTFVKTTLDGFRGQAIEAEGILTSSKRRITNLQFTGAVKTGPVWPEFSVRVPLAGQEFPAGVQFVFGASVQVR